MALGRVDGISTSAAGPGAYEPDEEWLLVWLAAVEEEITATAAGQVAPPIPGATLLAGTDLGAVQANWWLHGTAPDLGRGLWRWR